MGTNKQEAADNHAEQALWHMVDGVTAECAEEGVDSPWAWLDPDERHLFCAVNIYLRSLCSTHPLFDEQSFRAALSSVLDVACSAGQRAGRAGINLGARHGA